MGAKITILVTVYNIAKYLDRFFRNVMNQTVSDFKVLIIEDGSTDNSLEICNKYAVMDSRITVIPVKHIGISSARNMALDLIDTEYLASLDGDDFFDKDYLKHLIDAENKYHADLIISNVIYRNEELNEIDRFSERKEEYFTREQFPEILPELLRERRLNYLYGKLYKTSFLKKIRVHSDVMQGSDTMINSQFVMKISSIAVIENYDYNYIKYKKRSVTSYNGSSVFKRLYRINNYIYQLMRSGGMLNRRMEFVIDERVLYSGKIAVNGIVASNDPISQKIQRASEVLNSKEYTRAYYRRKHYGDFDEIGFPVIAPGEEELYVRKNTKILQEEKRRRFLRKVLPETAFDIWHKYRGDNP